MNNRGPVLGGTRNLRFIRAMLRRSQKPNANVDIAPYDFMQRLAESKMHYYLACGQEEIGSIIIVGGYLGEEILPMMAVYPNARFLVFEASRRYFETLRTKFSSMNRVTCVNMAVTDTCGKQAFYETSLTGSGSLLKLSAPAIGDYGAQQAESFEVDTTTLDAYLDSSDEERSVVDLLWCDVQGAELRVLKGATKTLERCRAVFLEISLWERMYEGACLISELQEILRPAGFVLCGLGTDPLNGTGNALYINPQRRGKKRMGL